MAGWRDYKPLNWLVQTVCLATGGAVCELVKKQMFGPSPYDREQDCPISCTSLRRLRPQSQLTSRA